MKALKISILATVALAAVSLSNVYATTVYALTDSGGLLTFDHQTPAVITNTVTVSNLGGYTLLGIDVRPTVQNSPSNPGVGTLWGIGKSGTSFQLFTIDPVTGVATAIGVPIAAGISSTPTDSQWGFDFNPTVDRIRLVNSAAANNNYRLDPNTGGLTFTDGNLAFEAGDPNFGMTPAFDGGAYATAAFGGTTPLFYIDATLNILARAVDPNAGSVQTVGALGMTIDEPNGFDIYGGLALFSAPIAGGSSLYTVNLSTGAATLVGAFPALTNVRGLAISLTDGSTGDLTRPSLLIFGKKKQVTHSGNFTLKIRASDDSGTVAVSYRIVKQSPSFKVIARHGKSDIYTVKLRRLPDGNNPILVRAVDPSGNETIAKVTIRRR